MEILLSLFLFVGIVIMITLVFIGYFLYSNSRKTADANHLLASKESDLVSLYDSLEQIMEEIEAYTKQCKQEIQENMEKVTQMYNEICAAPKPAATPLPETEKTPAATPPGERVLLERERLIKQYQRHSGKVGKKVRTFYDQGASVAEIAREMEIGQGEVQLRLNLINKQDNL